MMKSLVEISVESLMMMEVAVPAKTEEGYCRIPPVPIPVVWINVGWTSFVTSLVITLHLVPPYLAASTSVVLDKAIGFNCR